MTRWKAAGTHFLLSFFVIGLVIGFVVWRWYPPTLMTMAKAGTLLALLVCVDVILGPILTAIVFRPGKPGLKFDLVVIALVQLAALVYGLHTVWVSRPAYIVGTSDRFHLVFANELEYPANRPVPEAYRHAPMWGPEVVAAPLPSDEKARMAAMIAAMAGEEIQKQPARYAPFPPLNREPLQAALPAATAIAYAPPADRAQWQAAFARHPKVTLLAMLPLQSTRGSAAVLLDLKDGQILEYVALNPWPVIDAYRSDRTTAPREQPARSKPAG